MENFRVAITGADGLIGSAASEVLRAQGCEVVALHRGDGFAETWNPASGATDVECDALIHLAGESIRGRWTDDKKKAIRDSRIAPTEKLCRTLASRAQSGETSPSGAPRVILCASAIGFYGDRDGEILDETSPLGEGFLAQVTRDWEAATQPASEAGIRVVNLRFGIVLSENGGALAAMLPAFRLGLGGVLGSGKQWWSWVALPDVAAIIAHALRDENLSGAVNVVAPQPVTNREFTRALNSVLRRPNFFALPASVLHLAMGEAADALLLASARAAPHKLLESGYVFQQPQLNDVLRALL